MAEADRTDSVVDVSRPDGNRPDGLWKMARLDALIADPNAVEMLAQRVAGGEGLIAICRSLMVPHGRVLLWLMSDVGRFQTYQNALRASAFREADEAIAIADTPQMGVIRKVKGDGSEEVTEEDMLGHRKLQVDTRKWRAAKHAPDVYGDKVQVQAVANPGAVVDAALEMMARGLLDKMRVVSTQTGEGATDAQS